MEKTKQTVKRRAQLDRYYRATGRFMHLYASVEAEMLRLLMAWADVDPTVGKAIFSGTRTEDAAKLIRRLHESHGVKVEEWLSAAFSQLANINALRNDLVHYGFEVDKDGPTRVITNKSIAHIPERIRIHAISPEIFRDIIADLEEILDRLFEAWVNKISGGRRTKPSSGAPGRRAWRYKSSPQAQARKDKAPKKQ